MTRAAAPLTRRDWLEGGQRMLRGGGLAALKLRPLSASLGVSTGSFYHHFSNFDAFLAELAKFYSGEQLAENMARAREAPTPYERIVRASELAREVALPELIGAMKAWARRDTRAAAEVRALETALLDFLAECFRDLGFAPDEAAARAFVLLSTASGDVQQPVLSEGPGALGRLIIEMVCAPRTSSPSPRTA